jgi:hypothetical protein
VECNFVLRNTSNKKKHQQSTAVNILMVISWYYNSTISLLSITYSPQKYTCITCVWLFVSNQSKSLCLVYGYNICVIVWFILFCLILIHTTSWLYPDITKHKWPWSYGSWIYNYLWNQCISSLMLWVRISIRARCKTLCNQVCQWLATGRWFSPSPI